MRKRCVEIPEQGQPHNPGCPAVEAGGSQLSNEDPDPKKAEFQDTPQGSRRENQRPVGLRS